LYLRHTIRRKGGKEHTYWQLVRSVRRGGRVRQETVAQLGELDAQGRLRAQALAAQITCPYSKLRMRGKTLEFCRWAS